MNYEEAMNFIQNTNKFGSVLGLVIRKTWKPTRPA
jgi:hypothetical protein